MADCFAEYGPMTDASGRYATVCRPYHLVGLEFGISAVMAGGRGEATGVCREFNADAGAVGKAVRSLDLGTLPIGLADGVSLVRDTAKCEVVRWADVVIAQSEPAVRVAP